jgi:hypothetical protein
VSRSFVLTALMGLVLLVGSACTGPVSEPSSPVTGSASVPASVPASAPESTALPFDGRRLGAWSSTTYGGTHVEFAIPGGRVIKVRGRCSGSGELAVRIRGKAFAVDGRYACDGDWRYGTSLFPAATDPIDPGPFPVVIDRANTITSWEFEAYALTLTSRLAQTPS